jgi:iron complex outermembrane receptor protein
MVPGLYVAQTDAHIWQISARGFSDLNNNKMLVLVDGRSVYTPLYGGVYWDALDIPLENIDRVEVIRGPGGTLWGANAVNGVINIVTKSTSQAEGTLVSASLDKGEGYTATVRYGDSIGSKLGYYIYGRTSYWEPFQSPAGGNIPNWLMLPQVGLRPDWTLTGKDGRFSLGKTGTSWRAVEWSIWCCRMGKCTSRSNPARSNARTSSTTPVFSRWHPGRPTAALCKVKALAA